MNPTNHYALREGDEPGTFKVVNRRTGESLVVLSECTSTVANLVVMSLEATHRLSPGKS